MFVCQRLLHIVLSLVALTGSCQAAIVILPVQAVQDIILLPNTDFNAGSTELVVADVSVVGEIVFEWDETIGSSITLDNGSFDGSGFDERFGGGLTLTAGGSTLVPVIGLLENVMADGSRVLSGELTMIVPEYRVRLVGLDTDLEVRDPFLFRSNFDGLPPSPGTLYLSDPLTGDGSLLEIYLSGTDTLIGYSTNRRLVAVPEPSGVAVVSLLLSLCLLRNRRTDSTRSCQASMVCSF